MPSRISTAVLLAVTLLPVSIACAYAEASEKLDHGAHDQAGSSTISAAIAPASGLKPGEPATLTLSLTAKDGQPVTPADLQVAHTEKVHLLIIDPSLSDYHHVHPEPGSKPGTYVFTLTPKRAGEYQIFADLLPTASQQQQYAVARFTVAGTPSAIDKVLNSTATVAGYTFVLQVADGKITAGQPGMARLTVIGADGQPFAQLEPVMGAFAHMVGFNEERSEVAHIHPLGKEPETATERGGPTLEFHTHFATGGYKKLFAQVQIDGKPIFAPFGIEVTSAKPNQATPTSGHGTHGRDAAVGIPATIAELLAAVDQRVAAIEQAIASGKLAKVHGEAFAARDLLAALPDKTGGLNAAETKALNAALGRIRQQASLLDKFGDAGDAAQTHAVLIRFKNEIVGIRQQIADKPGR